MLPETSSMGPGRRHRTRALPPRFYYSYYIYSDQRVALLLNGGFFLPFFRPRYRLYYTATDNLAFQLDGIQTSRFPVMRDNLHGQFKFPHFTIAGTRKRHFCGRISVKDTTKLVYESLLFEFSFLFYHFKAIFSPSNRPTLP
jgi:hypothetical protein